MDCAFAYTSAKNQQKMEEYKNILSSIISSNDIVDAKGFIDHILSDDVPLAISKPLLRTFAEDLGKFEADNLKEIAEYTLLKIAPLGRLKEQAEFIASKMNCDDGMRGSIDKDIEVSRGMPKRRRVEAIPGSEERGSKDYEVGKDWDGTFEVLKGLNDLSGRKDYEVGKDWDGPSQVLKGSNDLSGRKLYEVGKDWDGSIQVLKGSIDLYGRKEYEALEGSVEVLNVEDLKGSNDLSGRILYEVGKDWDGSIQVLKGSIDLYGRKDYEALEGSVEVLNVEDFKGSNDLSGRKLYEVGKDGIQVLKSGCYMDYTDESEMKCDSEGLNAAKGSNEMAGGLLS